MSLPLLVSTLHVAVFVWFLAYPLGLAKRTVLAYENIFGQTR